MLYLIATSAHRCFLLLISMTNYYALGTLPPTDCLSVGPTKRDPLWSPHRNGRSEKRKKEPHQHAQPQRVVHYSSLFPGHPMVAKLSMRCRQSRQWLLITNRFEYDLFSTKDNSIGPHLFLSFSEEFVLKYHRQQRREKITLFLWGCNFIDPFRILRKSSTIA